MKKYITAAAILLFGLLAVLACKYHPALKLTPTAINLPQTLEVSPVLVSNTLYLVQSEHNQDIGTGLIIRKPDGTTAKSIPWPFAFASAANVGNQIWVHGVNTTSRGGNSIQRLVLDTGFNIVTSTTVYTAPSGTTIFNTSYDNGMLAIEAGHGHGRFHIGFLKSEGAAYTPVGGWFNGPDDYAACPTLKYINGQWYVFYMLPEKLPKPIFRGTEKIDYGYYTAVTRTSNFKSFHNARKRMLVPGPEDDINASDMDLLEKDGKVYINYSYGNQRGISGNRVMIYNGNLKAMANDLYSWF